MSGSYWRSPSYLDTLEWLVLSLNPRKARLKAKACSMIDDMQWQTLVGLDGQPPCHNETLLGYLERREDAFTCLIAIVSEQGFKEKAAHLREALPPAPLPTRQHPVSGISVASTHHSASPEHSKPQLVQEPPKELRPQESPLQLHVQPEAEAHLRPDDPPQPEANRRPPPVYPLDDLNSGRAQAAAESIRHDALNAASSALEGYRLSDSGAESTMKLIKVHFILGKVNPLHINDVLSTLRKKFKVDVKWKGTIEDPELKAVHMESGNTDLKEFYDTAITTVEIVVDVDKLLPEREREAVVQLIKSSLLSCGIKLDIRCIDDGSIVIYALLSITDLIRLYRIAASYPGVLAGLGILEIGTLGRDTRFSFRPSPAGPDRVPLDSSTVEFVHDLWPPDQVQEILGEANVHHAIRELISRLQPDGPTLERVLQWLKAHIMERDGENSDPYPGTERRGLSPLPPSSSVASTPHAESSDGNEDEEDNRTLHQTGMQSLDYLAGLMSQQPGIMSQQHGMISLQPKLFSPPTVMAEPLETMSHETGMQFLDHPAGVMSQQSEMPSSQPKPADSSKDQLTVVSQVTSDILEGGAADVFESPAYKEVRMRLIETLDMNAVRIRAKVYGLITSMEVDNLSNEFPNPITHNRELFRLIEVGGKQALKTFSRRVLARMGDNFRDDIAELDALLL